MPLNDLLGVGGQIGVSSQIGVPKSVGGFTSAFPGLSEGEIQSIYDQTSNLSGQQRTDTQKKLYKNKIRENDFNDYMDERNQSNMAVLRKISPINSSDADVADKTQAFAGYIRNEIYKVGGDYKSKTDKELLDDFFTNVPGLKDQFTNRLNGKQPLLPREMEEKEKSLGNVIKQAGDKTANDITNIPVVGNSIFGKGMADTVSGFIQGLGNITNGLEGLAGKGQETVNNVPLPAVKQIGNSIRTIIGKDPLTDQEAENIVKDNSIFKSYTTAGQDLLNLGEGTLNTLFTATMPYLTTIMNTASETKAGSKVLSGVSNAISAGGEILNNIPGLKQRRDNLPDEDKQRLDSFVGNVAVLGATDLGIKVVKKVPDIVSGVGKYTASQISGLNPSTIQTIVDAPDFNTIKSTVSREGLLSKINSALEQKIQDLSETGKEYKDIRKADNNVDIQNIKQSIPSILDDEFGIKINNGKIVDSGPIANGTTDYTALQKSITELYNSADNLTNEQAINTKQRLSSFIDFDNATTTQGQAVLKSISKNFGDYITQQIPGLSDLNQTYGTIASELKTIKKDWFNKDGTLKDGAYSKIANLTKKGNEGRLQRLEQTLPGISKDINILSSLEDIDITKGQKVATYIKAAFTGGGATAGSIFGPLGAVVGATLGIVLTSPSIIVPILENVGKMKGLTSDMIESIKTKLETGKKLIGSDKVNMQKILKAPETLDYIKANYAANNQRQSQDTQE